MNKKTVALIAMIVSALLVVFGVLIMTGTLGGDASYASSSYLYDSGYTEFGADFYTYVSNNAAEAASAARTVASNLKNIATLLRSACGIFLVGFGLLSLCHFTMVWLDEKKAAVDAPETEPAEIVETPENQEEVAPAEDGFTTKL